MKNLFFTPALCLLTAGFLAQNASAQMSTPPASKSELETFYTTTVENRTVDILKQLDLADGSKSNLVHDLIIKQYRALRARDEVIDGKLKAEGKEINYTNRAGELASSSKELHDQFLSKLGEALTPEQVEKVKDLMTYNKVKFTYDGYCNIVPDLTETDKARILELLKQAREEAVDGGSAPEKSSIFQKYKDQINNYLDAHGHDVAKAVKEYQAKQPTAAK